MTSFLYQCNGLIELAQQQSLLLTGQFHPGGHTEYQVMSVIFHWRVDSNRKNLSRSQPHRQKRPQRLFHPLSFGNTRLLLNSGTAVLAIVNAKLSSTKE